MRKKQLLFGASLFLVCASLVFNASDCHAQHEKGDKELLISGTIDFSFGDSSYANGNIFLQFGRFFTEKQEAGVGSSLNFSSGAGGGTNFTGGGFAFYRYNFKTKKPKLRPYIGYETGGTRAKGVSFVNTLYAYPNGGLKYYFKRNVALDFNTGYFFTYKKPTGQDSLKARIGIAFVF